MSFVYLYLISVPILIVLDLLWTRIVAINLYQVRLAPILAPTRNWVAASFFYLIFVFGLTFFATNPALTAGSWLIAIVLGGMYGLFTYATYDLTNQATLRGWPLLVTVIDIIWGTALGATVATLAFLITSAAL